MIWLIGNKGMLGSDLEQGLKEKDIPYTASDVEVDITDIDNLRKFALKKEITWIVNCSAYTAVDKAEDEQALAFKINADGVLNIAKIASEKNAKLIHISTDYIFDGEKEGEYFEIDEPNPMGIYGMSKLKGEKNIIQTIQKYFIIRIAWLFGKNGNNFAFTMLNLFKERDELRVVSDQWGTPTFTKDLVDLLLKIIDDSSDNYGIYHFTNIGRTNWYNFAYEIYKTAKKYKLIEKDIVISPINTEDFPTKAKRPKNSLLSKEKTINTFGIKIQSWEEAVDDFILNLSATYKRASK